VPSCRAGTGGEAIHPAYALRCFLAAVAVAAGTLSSPAPAQQPLPSVEGWWSVKVEIDDGGELALQLGQMHQVLWGIAVVHHWAGPVTGTLEGNRITLSVDVEGHFVDFEGEVKGDVLEGSVKAGGKNGRWRATRARVP
jgi:hypothetical protein